MLQNTLWYEKYRPTSIDQCFLPAEARKIFEKYIEDRSVPNLILSGPPGIGKTTVARVLLESIDAEFIQIPSSLRGNIDTLRNEIQQFASTISLNGQKKYVILDEADNLTSATQFAMRGFIDEYSTNCGFIFTCNYQEKILSPISESRLTKVSFTFKNEEKGQLAKSLYALLVRILTAESIEFDPQAVRQYLVNHLQRSSDIRRLLVRAETIGRTGKFDMSSLTDTLSERFDSLIEALKAKNFSLARTWIGENSDIEPERIYRSLYEQAKQIVTPQMVGGLVLIIAKYQFQQAFVADSEINLAACMIEIMTECL